MNTYERLYCLSNILIQSFYHWMWLLILKGISLSHEKSYHWAIWLRYLESNSALSSRTANSVRTWERESRWNYILLDISVKPLQNERRPVSYWVLALIGSDTVVATYVLISLTFKITLSHVRAEETEVQKLGHLLKCIQLVSGRVSIWTQISDLRVHILNHYFELCTIFTAVQTGIIILLLLIRKLELTEIKKRAQRQIAGKEQGWCSNSGLYDS